MSDIVVFLLLGLSNGAVFAALASGLVLTYRSSGVINFATGSIALITAYFYAFLRQGKLLNPFPGLPSAPSIGHAFGLWPALILSMAFATVIGVLLHVLVFWPLRNSPPVAKVIASVGLSVVITTVLVARFGTVGPLIQPLLPSNTLSVFGVRISTDRLYFAGAVIALALVLTVLYRHTRFGLATRAVAQSEKGAYVSGVSPGLVALGNWVISSMVAGMAGILIGPITQLTPAVYTLFIIPSLAAAVVGQFQNLLVAVFVGLGIGMLQSEGTYLQSRVSWLPSSGLAELIPLVIVLTALVVRARPLPSRGTLAARALGHAPRPLKLRLTSGVATVSGASALFILQGEWRAAFITSMVFAIIALSLVVVTGYAGQVSLAQLTLAGAAGFVLGPLTNRFGIPFPIAPLLAALAATVLGVVVGLPALRIRGLPVAIVTLTLAYTISAIWFNNVDIVPPVGVHIGTPHLFGYDLGLGSGTQSFPRVRFGVLVLVVLVIVALGVARLRTSRLGSQMLAVRANERSAAVAGVHVVRVKIAAFAIGAFIAGLGGTLLAYRQETVVGTSYTAVAGLVLFTTVYLAGITSVSGGILAGLIAADGLMVTITDHLFSAGDWYQVIAAVLLVFTVIFNPEGLVGPGHLLIARRRASSKPVPSRGPLQPHGVVRPRSDRVAAEGTRAVPALEVVNLSVHYGGVTALDRVSFAVPDRAIVGLIGPNGAGKTTLIDAICGFTGCSGTVRLGGADISGKKSFERARAGLARTFQAVELYDDLTVEENVVVGLVAAGKRRKALSDEALTRTFELLGIDHLRDRLAGELSQGHRQLVSIARALAGQPKVLLLDEPAGGLDARESEWLGERLRDLRDSGVTILMVDHDMNLVLSLCDEIQVLNFGVQIAAGPPAQVRADRGVAQAYLGTTHAHTTPAIQATS